MGYHVPVQLNYQWLRYQSISSERCKQHVYLEDDDDDDDDDNDNANDDQIVAIMATVHIDSGFQLTWKTWKTPGILC